VSKPRLLIPMSIQFSVRYLVRTGLLNQLSSVVQPVILLDWKDESLERELKQMGAEVHYLIPAQVSPDYTRIRSWMNLLHKKRLNTPSEAIWERRGNVGLSTYSRLRRRARKKSLLFLASVIGGERALRRKEQRLFEIETNSAEVQRQIDSLQPDAAFSITPFLDNEHMALRACQLRKVPLCASILSFDNITTRGLIPIDFDQYLLWNRYNANELFRAYPHIQPSQVTVVGAPQFDFYWNPDIPMDESHWRRQLSLPAGAPIILYGGGHHFCAQHEPRFLQQLDDAIENNEIRRDAVILFRNHPVDVIERWLPVLKNAKHIVCDDPASAGRVNGKNNMPIEDIRRLASTLVHSKVHVNVASTMTVDGAIFDRPQVGPAYDDAPGSKHDRTARDLYLQEHYLPITNAGGLDIVHSREQLVQAVQSALDHPHRLAAGRKRIVQEVCTYSDGRAAERVAEAVLSFLGQLAPGVHATVGSH
jgi:hypothetical protein